MNAKTSWQTIIALVVLILATLLYQDWVWGVMFFYWGVRMVVGGKAFLVEEIAKTENPLIFYLVILFWFSLGIITLWEHLSTMLVR